MGHGIDSEDDFEARMDAETLERAQEIKDDPKRLQAAENAAKIKIRSLVKVVRETSLVTGKETLIA